MASIGHSGINVTTELDITAYCFLFFLILHENTNSLYWCCFLLKDLQVSEDLQDGLVHRDNKAWKGRLEIKVQMACLVKTVNCSHVYIFFLIYLHIFPIYCLKCFKMPKEQSEAVHQRRTDHTMKTKTLNDLQHIFDISLQKVNSWIALIIIQQRGFQRHNTTEKQHRWSQHIKNKKWETRNSQNISGESISYNQFLFFYKA